MAPLGEFVLGYSNLIEDTIALHIAKRLRSRRKHLGLTQHQIGDRVGVRFQQIQKYECAACRVSASRLWSLAEALQVTTGYFFEGLQVVPAGQADATSDWAMS
jgi:transcriptional regulator with XRE-family HTH domain